MSAEAPIKRIKPPKPGMYTEVPFEEYVRWEAINNSSLGPIVPPDGSPAQYKHALANPQQDTRSLRLGRLTHLGKLEPANLLNRYWVLDEAAVAANCRNQDGSVPANISAAKRSKKWQELVDKLHSANSGKEQILQSELDQLIGMCNALSHCPKASTLIRDAKHREVSWVLQMRSGRKIVAMLKGRVDLLHTNYLADLKTCADISDRGIARAIRRYGYHRQAAFYQDAFLEFKGKLLPFFGIFVQPVPPHIVRCAPFSQAALDQGRAEYQKAIELIVECRKNDNWPVPDPPEHGWQLPPWSQSVQIEDREVYG